MGKFNYKKWVTAQKSLQESKKSLINDRNTTGVVWHRYRAYSQNLNNLPLCDQPGGQATFHSGTGTWAQKVDNFYQAAGSPNPGDWIGGTGAISPSAGHQCWQYEGISTSGQLMGFFDDTQLNSFPDCETCERNENNGTNDKPCKDFMAATPQMQNNCCVKCAAGSVTNPSDPCYILTEGCKCCPDPTGGDERGCMDPTAINYNVCCPGNNYPGCVPNIPSNEDCCEYEDNPNPCKDNPNPECFWCHESTQCQPVGTNLGYALANSIPLFFDLNDCQAQSGCGPREEPMVYCECCKGSNGQSMAQQVPASQGCIGAENTVYAGLGVYGCQVSPVSGGPGTKCKKPLPTGGRQIPMGPTLGEKKSPNLSIVKKAIQETINQLSKSKKGCGCNKK